MLTIYLECPVPLSRNIFRYCPFLWMGLEDNWRSQGAFLIHSEVLSFFNGYDNGSQGARVALCAFCARFTGSAGGGGERAETTNKKGGGISGNQADWATVQQTMVVVSCRWLLQVGGCPTRYQTLKLLCFLDWWHELCVLSTSQRSVNFQYRY